MTSSISPRASFSNEEVIGEYCRQFAPTCSREMNEAAGKCYEKVAGLNFGCEVASYCGYTWGGWRALKGFTDLGFLIKDICKGKQIEVEADVQQSLLVNDTESRRRVVKEAPSGKEIYERTWGAVHHIMVGGALIGVAYAVSQVPTWANEGVCEEFSDHAAGMNATCYKACDDATEWVVNLTSALVKNII